LIENIYQTLTAFPSKSKFIKNSPLGIILSTLFLVFGNVVKHSPSFLIYYVQPHPVLFTGVEVVSGG